MTYTATEYPEIVTRRLKKNLNIYVDLEKKLVNEGEKHGIFGKVLYDKSSKGQFRYVKVKVTMIANEHLKWEILCDECWKS